MAKRDSALLTACAGLVAIGALMSAFAQGNAPTHHRTIRYVTGRPLATLIKTGDTDLTVVAATSPPLRVQAPPGMTEIEWETRGADVILRVHVIKKQPALTNGGDWVKTLIFADIKEVLKPASKATFSVGEHVSFTMDGGDVTLTAPTNAGPTVVHADVPWAIPFQTDVDYLIFGWLPSPTELVVSPHAAYELTTDGYVRSLLRDRSADEINGALASQVLGAIRSIPAMAPR
jgi:hypothetical protein